MHVPEVLDRYPRLTAESEFARHAATHGDVFVLERRELFGPLPETLQGRIKSEVSQVSKRMLSCRDQLSQKTLNWEPQAGGAARAG